MVVARTFKVCTERSKRDAAYLRSESGGVETQDAQEPTKVRVGSIRKLGP